MPKIYLKRLVCAIVYIILSFTFGCAFTKVEINKPEFIDKKKKVFIYGTEDKAKVYQTVKNNFIRLGFVVVEDKSEAGLILDYDFDCYWDLIYYNCTRFSMFLSDAKTDEIIFQAKYIIGEFLSSEAIVNRVFNKLENKLDKAPLAQPVI